MCNFPEDLIKEIQTIFRKVPTLIIGSGHSCAYGLPSLRDISDYLLAEIPEFLSETDPIRLWDSIKYSINEDFEEGLNGLSPSDKGVDELLQTIRQLITRLFREKCSEAEQKLISEGILTSPENNALIRLMKILYEGCSPNASCIDIITTNYDTLLELLSDAAGLPVQTGFHGHRFRGFSQEKLERPIYSRRTITEKGRVRATYRTERSIRILKPHGSINWIIDGGRTTEMLAYDDSNNGAIVVPGPFKYRDALVNSLFDEIRAIMNQVLKGAKAIVAIGFGFNDDHLQNILRDRLDSGIQILILTKEWTDSINKLIKKYENVIAFQQHGDGAICAWKGKIFQIHHPLWELNSFLEYVVE